MKVLLILEAGTIIFGRAYYKAQLATGNTLAVNGRIFLSISRRDGIENIREIGIGLKSLTLNS